MKNLPLKSSSHAGPHQGRLNSLIQRLHATKLVSAPPAVTTPSTVDVKDDARFLSSDEAASLSAEQAAFLVRKRKAAAGLGPIMPAASACQFCDGIGTRCCHQCNGTGQNGNDKANELFRKEGAILVQNGLMDVQWMFMEGGPCWLCKGNAHVACSDCSGTGIAGGVDRYTGD